MEEKLSGKSIADLRTASACPADQMPSGPSGSCMCDNGTPPGPNGGCIVLATCPPGQALPNGTCCQAPFTPGPQGACQCPAPLVLDQEGQCAPSSSPQQKPCPPTQIPGPNGCTCPQFQVLGPNGCQFEQINTCPNGERQLDGTCVIPFSICPAWQQTSTGTCCPQNQYPAPDGTCQSLCEPGQTFEFNTGTCTGNTPGCIQSPPLQSQCGGSPYAGPCCQPNQAPAMNGGEYSGYCCPAGQQPDPRTGSCLPQQTTGLLSKCPIGQGDYNPATGTCCGPGSKVTNRYQCCPTGQYPQANGTCGCPWTGYTNYPGGACSPLCPNPSGRGLPTAQNCSNCPPGMEGWPGCCQQSGGFPIVQGTCSQCLASQVATVSGCCPQSQAASDGSFCCPPGNHAVGAACFGNTSMSTVPRNCPPGETVQENGKCGVKPPVETPGAGVRPGSRYSPTIRYSAGLALCRARRTGAIPYA